MGLEVGVGVDPNPNPNPDPNPNPNPDPNPTSPYPLVHLGDRIWGLAESPGVRLGAGLIVGYDWGY